MTRADHIWAAAAEVLTAKQLEAFTLRHRHELAIPDIAAHLGISRQAVSERITKAELRIARHLAARKAAA